MAETRKCKDELQTAKIELRKLLETKAEQEVRLERSSDELKNLETGRGERVLAAILADDEKNVRWSETQTVVAKQSDIAATKGVLSVLEDRIKAGERVVVECKVNCLRAEADKLDRRANTRQKKTDELLHQLYEFEEVEYVPAPPKSTHGIATLGKFDLPARPSIHGEALSGGEGGGFLGVVVKRIPITEWMRFQANFYRDAAERLLEGKLVNVSDFSLPDYL